jgi:hypothetical protein
MGTSFIQTKAPKTPNFGKSISKGLATKKGWCETIVNN